MRISVIIPTYNRVNGLRRALESILKQTVKPSEIIIIDDASNQDVKKDLNMYFENKELNITYYRFKENSGACAARNYGAHLATGQILMFLDDDDTWEKDKIQKQKKVFLTNKNVDLVYTGKLLVNERERNKIIRKVNPNVRGKLYPKIMYKNLLGTTSGIALKKDLFEQIGGFDESLPAMQDFDFYIRYCKICRDVEHDNSCNVRYTIANDPNKQISGSGIKQKKAVNILLQKYRNELKSLSYLERRKIKASWTFSIANAMYKRSYFKSIKYSIISIITFPNLRATGLLVPPFFMRFFRG